MHLLTTRQAGFVEDDRVVVRLDQTPADVVVLLNQDTRCLAGWPEAILAPFDDPAVGAVGCKIYADDERTILHVGAGLDAPRRGQLRDRLLQR